MLARKKETEIALVNKNIHNNIKPKLFSFNCKLRDDNLVGFDFFFARVIKALSDHVLSQT